MLGTLKRAFEKFQADEMGDRAAAMTYYVMMSLFPGLLVAVSLLGLFGNESLVTDAVRYARDHGAPPEVADAVRKSLQTTIGAAGGAVSSALVLGVVVAIYGASGAFGGAGRALNTVYGVRESRSFVIHKLVDIGWTLVAMALAIVALVSVFLGGGIAHDLFGTIGLGDTAVTIWHYLRWVVAVVAVLLMYAITYSFAPDIKPRRLRWVTPGAATGVVIWVLASAGFFFYVSNFGKYGATYGAFAGAIILLLWLYLSSLAFLFGAELNAENERERRPRASDPPPPTPQPPPAWPAAEGSGNGRYVDEKYGRDVLAP